MRSLFIVFFLSLWALCGFAQNKFSGKVISASTKETLPFVNIVINNNAYGTISDIDGKFTISFGGEIQYITFSYIGFEVLKISPAEFPKNGIIRLQEKSNLLQEIVITPGENPAHRIIKEAVKNKEQNHPEKITSFTYESYNKFYGTLTPISPEKEIQLKDSLEEKADSYFNKRHLFMSENITQRKFIAPNHNQETVIANRFSGLKNPNFASVATDFQPFSFYNNTIKLLNKDYLNPISKGTLNQYDFALEDTLFQGKDTVYVISFRPFEKKNFFGLKGVVYINTNQFAVQNVIAESAETDELISFKIQQQYEYLEGKYWFPTQLDASFVFNEYQVANRKILLVNRSYIRNVTFSPAIRKRDFSEVTFEIQSQASKKDSLFWQDKRFDTLSVKEQETFHFLDSVSTKNNLEGIVKLTEIATFGKVPVFKVLDLPLNSLINFNEFEGLRVGMELYTSPRLSEKFTLGGYFAYGTKDKLWKYGGSLETNIYPKRNFKLGVSYQKDVFEPAQSDFIGEVDWLNNQLREVLTFRMDKTELAKVSLAIRPIRYTQLEASFSQIKRETGYIYQYLGGDLPVNIFNFTEAKIGLTYIHKQDYIKVSGRKRMISASYPIIAVNYTKGFSDILEGQFEYDKIEARIDHQFRIRKIGQSAARLQGGWLQGSVPYPLLFNLYASNTNDLPAIVDYTFQTADLYEFTANRYVALLFRHNFGALFFRGKKFKPEFVAIHNMAIGELNNPEFHQDIDIKTFDKGFLESGLEITKIIRFKYLNLFYVDLGGGAFFRYGDYRNDNIEDNWVFKLSLRSFF